MLIERDRANRTELAIWIDGFVWRGIFSVVI
jgi:hypothetical protein